MSKFLSLEFDNVCVNFRFKFFIVLKNKARLGRAQKNLQQPFQNKHSKRSQQLVMSVSLLVTCLARYRVVFVCQL
jgi:hypothetical protein